MYFTGHSVPCSGHNTARPTHPHGGGVHAVQELLRFLASTREAQEIEHKRRIAWEQEQEAKYKLRQAEMERRMVEMQQEITALKARVAFSSPTSSAPSVTVPQLQYSAPQQPTPNTSPTLSHPSTPGTFSPPTAEASSYATRFINVNPLGNTRAHSEAGTESEEDDEGPAQYRARRKNHHDTRCLTIQVLCFQPASVGRSSRMRCQARDAQSFIACHDAGYGQGAARQSCGRHTGWTGRAGTICMGQDAEAVCAQRTDEGTGAQGLEGEPEVVQARARQGLWKEDVGFGV